MRCIVLIYLWMAFALADAARAKVVCESEDVVVEIARLYSQTLQMQIDAGEDGVDPMVQANEERMRELSQKNCFDTDWTLNSVDEAEILDAPLCRKFHSYFSRPIPDVYWFECSPAAE